MKLFSVFTLFFGLHLTALADAMPLGEGKPNIVYIMADEIGYYELGHMGNSLLHTPNIDRLAEEGIRFTHALAASPVCAPLRASLLTGKHSGHTSVRSNNGDPLRADEVTIASILKQRGYATGGFGKWGVGGRDSTGIPEDHGFDVFFGYYDQQHAHTYYPAYLLRNSDEVQLPGNDGGRYGAIYSHYRIMEEATKFIRTNRNEPFFAYIPLTAPHDNYDIPTDDPAWELYENDSWLKSEGIDQDVRNYAAMISMVDRSVGDIFNLLKELSLERESIVIFSGDNGGSDRFSSKLNPRGFFGPNKDPLSKSEFRGGKASLYEGGLRIPFIVRWPGKIKPGKVSDLVFSQVDVFPTLAAMAGVTTMQSLDGVSIYPEIVNSSESKLAALEKRVLYWEFRGQTAVRIGDLKAIQPSPDSLWELYDLSKDVSENSNIASQYPEVIALAKRHAEISHEPIDPGIFRSRKQHEKDRAAKWGSSGRPISLAWLRELVSWKILLFSMFLLACVAVGLKFKWKKYSDL